MARSAVRNRRGVWTTYGGGGSWESILFQAPGQDPLDVLGQLKDVSSVERDVTRAVYSGDFIEPDGGWMLVVHSKYQDWIWLVGTHSLLRSLMENSPGRWLRTGHENTSGAVYVEVREDGERTLFFSSDGVAWDEDEDDNDIQPLPLVDLQRQADHNQDLKKKRDLLTVFRSGGPQANRAAASAECFRLSVAAITADFEKAMVYRPICAA